MQFVTFLPRLQLAETAVNALRIPISSPIRTCLRRCSHDRFTLPVVDIFTVRNAE
jgi:hypothetical protein